jgi:hypothetical protein
MMLQRDRDSYRVWELTVGIFDRQATLRLPFELRREIEVLIKRHRQIDV